MIELANLIDKNKEILAAIESWDNGSTPTYSYLAGI